MTQAHLRVQHQDRHCYVHQAENISPEHSSLRINLHVFIKFRTMCFCLNCCGLNVVVVLEAIISFYTLF